MARVAAALALVLLVQGALAAPTPDPACGCPSLPVPPVCLPSPCGFPGSFPGYGGLDASALGLGLTGGLALPGSLGYNSALLGGVSPDYAYGGLSPDYAYGGLSPAYAGAGLLPGYGGLAPGYGGESITPPAPVGAPTVAAVQPGAPNAYTVGPFCQTSTVETPVKSASTASSGPVTQQTDIVDGYCSTSCPATRAKCGGTTKNVSFKTPTIINKGSKTYSTVSVIGAPVTQRSTVAGKPEVNTAVTPGPQVPPTPVPAGPSALYGDYGVPYGSYPYNSYPYGSDATFVSGLSSPYPGAALLPGSFGAYPYASPVPTSTLNLGTAYPNGLVTPPPNCACSCNNYAY